MVLRKNGDSFFVGEWEERNPSGKDGHIDKVIVQASNEFTGRSTIGVKRMPLYMDIHKRVDGATSEAVTAAHMRDLEEQDKYGVKYLKYWFDESTGTIFCLVEAPDKEAAERVHREAHGLTADEIHEVTENM